MKQVFSYYLLLITLYSFADMPGNKPRPDYDVKITGLKENNDYTFYFQGYDSVMVLKDSSSIHIQGGMGAPMCVNVWAVQHKTNRHTDTVSFCSGDRETSIETYLYVIKNHLSFGEKVTTPVKKKIERNEPVNIVGDISSNNNWLIMYLISGVSFLVLIALVFFVWNKNRKSKMKQP